MLFFFFVTSLEAFAHEENTQAYSNFVLPLAVTGATKLERHNVKEIGGGHIYVRDGVHQ